VLSSRSFEHLLRLSGSIENMPNCSPMKASRGSAAAIRCADRLMRSRISSSSTSQSARSSGSSSTMRTAAAP
jgi:hypothetical protein